MSDKLAELVVASGVGRSMKADDKLSELVGLAPIFSYWFDRWANNGAQFTGSLAEWQAREEFSPPCNAPRAPRVSSGSKRYLP